jgi:hypothetical protein
MSLVTPAYQVSEGVQGVGTAARLHHVERQCGTYGGNSCMWHKEALRRMAKQLS